MKSLLRTYSICCCALGITLFSPAVSYATDSTLEIDGTDLTISSPEETTEKTDNAYVPPDYSDPAVMRELGKRAHRLNKCDNTSWRQELKESLLWLTQEEYDVRFAAFEEGWGQAANLTAEIEPDCTGIETTPTWTKDGGKKQDSGFYSDIFKETE